MKRIIIFFLFCTNALCFNSSFCQSESDYRRSFAENISELDPIEGIYKLRQRLTITVYGEKQVSTNTSTVVITDVGNGMFRLKTLRSDNPGNPAAIETLITRIGETNAYDMSTSYKSGDKTTTRIYLESLFHFETSGYTPTGVIRYNLPKNLKSQASSITSFTEFYFVKDFPTSSMYENAIAKKQEEAASSRWSGTGFALENGYMVTNYHVVEDARIINVKGVQGDVNTVYSVEVVATDKVNDIAILKITDSKFKGFGTVPYSVSSRMADVGEDIFVLGYPLTQTMGDEIKLTNGIISSRTGFQGDIANYQMSAPIQPGNSGGPMFDSKGNVIGIVCAHHAGAENAGYAIKTSYLKILIESTGLNINFPANNTISALSLAEKVKRVKKFVYYIECSK